MLSHRTTQTRPRHAVVIAAAAVIIIAITTATHLSIFVYWLPWHKHRVSHVFIHAKIDHLRSCIGGSCHFVADVLKEKRTKCTFHVRTLCFRFLCVFTAFDFFFQTLPIPRANVTNSKNGNARVSKLTKWTAIDRSQLYTSNKIIMFDILKMRSIVEDSSAKKTAQNKGDNCYGAWKWAYYFTRWTELISQKKKK